MVDSITSTQVTSLQRTQSSGTVSKASQRAAQALFDQLQQKPGVVAVSNKPLAATSKPPANLPRGSLVDISV